MALPKDPFIGFIFKIQKNGTLILAEIKTTLLVFMFMMLGDFKVHHLFGATPRNRLFVTAQHLLSCAPKQKYTPGMSIITSQLELHTALVLQCLMGIRPQQTIKKSIKTLKFEKHRTGALHKL